MTTLAEIREKGRRDFSDEEDKVLCGEAQQREAAQQAKGGEPKHFDETIHRLMTTKLC